MAVVRGPLVEKRRCNGMSRSIAYIHCTGGPFFGGGGVEKVLNLILSPDEHPAFLKSRAPIRIFPFSGKTQSLDNISAGFL
jgi:hypothetical protein